ncbi:MAG: beta strand repeat-containing protein [Bacteroidota bacterium]
MHSQTRTRCRTRLLLLMGFVFLLLPSLTLQAQVTIVSESFNTSTVPALLTGWTASATGNGTGTPLGGGTWVTNGANVSSGYAGASGGNKMVVYNTPANTTHTLVYNNNLSTIGYNNIKVFYGGRRSSSTTVMEATFEYSIDGTTWTPVSITTPQTTAGTWAIINGGAGLSLPPNAANVANLQFKWSFTAPATASTSANYSWDDLVVQGNPVGLIYNTSAFNGNFGSVKVGNSSTSSSFTVEGNGLTQNIVITPPAGFEMRTGTNPFSTNPITLTQSGGNVALTTVDVRFTPLAYQAYSGNISLVSGIYSRTIPVSGLGAIKSIASGNWSNPATWDGGVVPNATQNVYISSAFPVTIDIVTATCKSIDFDAAGTTGLLIMGGATSTLSVNGDFNLGNTSQLIFNTWPAGAKLKFVGSAAIQTINGLNTGTTNSAGIMELVVDKSAGKLTTPGNNNKLTIGTSLEIVSGTFELGLADDIFGRDQAGANTQPSITIQPAGTFTIFSNGASQINAGSASSGGKIGKMTIYGMAELSTTSSVGMQFNDIDVESGGTLRLMPTWFTTSTIAFNAGVVTVKAGGTLRYSTTSTSLWNPAASVIMNDGSILNITTVTAPTLAPTFTDNGATWRYNFSGNQDGVGIATRSVKNLELAAGGIKTFAGGAAIDVTGTLILSETSSLSLGTGSLTYGTGATLQYGNATQIDPQMTTDSEWPNSATPPRNVRIQNAGGVTLHSNRRVQGNLDLVNGVLSMGNNGLIVGSTSGGSAASYVSPNGTGYFRIDAIGATPVLFPVGNGSYTPFTLSNSGTVDDFLVQVGAIATTFADPIKSVNRYWLIQEATAGGSNVDLNFQWNASDENFSFDRTMITALRDNVLVGTAGPASGSGPYTKSFNGVTGFGMFGITNSPNDLSATALIAPTNGGCKTSTESVTVTIKNLSVYPIDFSKNHATVTVTATGGYSSSMVLTTGTLGVNASQHVTLPATIDMSAGGSFTFNASVAVTGDVNTINNALAAVTLSASAQPTATIAYAGTPYCASLAGAQSVTLTGTTGGTFSSSVGLTLDASTGAITPSTSTAGNYTVTYAIAAANGCNAVNATTSVVVYALRNASFNYGATNTFCQTGSNPTATITGTPGGTFTATPVGLSINSSTGAINLTTSALNSYAVTYTTPGPCEESLTLNVSVTSAPSANFSYANTSYCSNGTNPLPIFGSGASGGVFSASPAGLVFVSTATGELNLSASTPGTYTVNNDIAAGGGCAAASASTTITITALPQASIGYGGAPYCIGNTSNQPVIFTGTTGGVYSNQPAGLSINTSTGSVLPSSSTIGSYTVSYTIAASGGCSAVIATTPLVINPLPAANISYSGNPYCASETSPQAVTQTGTLGGTYSATPAGLSINTSTGAITPSASTPGTYTVTYSVPASGGCAALNVATSVTISPIPNAIISYVGTPFCASLTTAQAVTLTGTTGGVFSTPAGLSMNPSTGAITPSTSTPGSYTVTYFIAAAGGCAAFTTTANILITAVPQASISYAGTPFCSSVVGAQAVTFTGVTGGSYSTTPSGLSLNTVNGAITPSTSTAGSYTVSYTIPAILGCPARPVTTTVTITPAPTATISYPATPYCQGSGLAAVTRTGFTGGVYSSTPGLVINANTGEINLNTSTPGTYTVTYFIAAAGGCASFSTITSITISQLSVAATSATATPATFCGPTNVTLRTVGGTLAPGASWVWYSGSCGGTRVGTGATLTLTGVSTSTTYFVRAEGGTCSNSACVSTTVTINTVPTIQIDVLGDTSLLPGKTCTLIATATPLNAANVFAWFFNGTQVAGATGSSFVVDVDKIGLYSVRVTTPSGCSATSASRRITAASSANAWVIPNPSTGRFQVRFYSRATVFNFKRTLLVYDTRGVLVHSVTVPITGPYSSIDVDLTAKPRGLYFLFLRKENEEKLGAGRIFLY